MEPTKVDACAILALTLDKSKEHRKEFQDRDPVEVKEKEELILFHNKIRASVYSNLLSDWAAVTAGKAEAGREKLFFPAMSRETAEKIEELTKFPRGLEENPSAAYERKLTELKKRLPDEDPKFSEEKEILDDWFKTVAREAQEKVAKYRQFEEACCKTGEDKVLGALHNIGVANGKEWLPILVERDRWPDNNRIVALQKKYGTPLITSVGYTNKLGGNDEIEIFKCFLRPSGQ